MSEDETLLSVPTQPGATDQQPSPAAETVIQIAVPSDAVAAVATVVEKIGPHCFRRPPRLHRRASLTQLRKH